ncbi:iron-siderophore ABC transporter substrate-binding protein [Phytoactinopolyspora alkaliphila]|uniref:Iron-siderophore ABC transporter substrate-binding protein n=1 Tax=Phytoactinopolyspora alkaliphila TaxID=1783498 RepID=A0A6N9YMM6_9ACTN|nr:iron-siderophore ABC transporter substrate-binding protein [Phytoactinopolyspora alkaliphila]NED96109.1 iron-siderophore ABC transporter substrate-binding protein [Phytoactinopolyspora alkaliphila]
MSAVWTRMPARRRARPAGHPPGLVALAAVTSFTLFAAACGSGDGDELSAADQTGSADTAENADAFPVSIDSALGTAVIESEPERIVTIGWGVQDTVLALGKNPVGVEYDEWSGDADGYRPWFREAVESAGGDLPATFALYPEIDMDAIVALEPDLILAPNSGITQDDFDILNELAPTVAYPGRAWATPWDTEIELIGEALGKSDEASAFIDDIAGQFAEAADEHPEFEGVSFAYIYAVQPGQLHLYQRHDPRVEFLARLGFEEVPELAEMELSEGQFTTDLGLEQADLLDDADLIVTWFNDETNQAEAEAQPLYAQIPAVQRGTYLPVIDRHLAAASSMLTPLTVPWVIDDYVDLLSDAVAGLD